MEAKESPLDVLSRAATMLQEQSPIIHEHIHVSAKQLPTIKWKRDRRASRPDYLRRSDSKVSDDDSNATVDCSSKRSHTEIESADSSTVDKPLDMSVRQRGLPPTYIQAISELSRTSSRRSPPPVTSSSATSSNATSPTPKKSTSPLFVNGREDLPSGISMVDPIIDEHFRRSLGKDYLSVFNATAANNNNSTNGQTVTSSAPKTPSPPPEVVVAVSQEPPKKKLRTPSPPICRSVSPDADESELSSTSSSRVEVTDANAMSVDDHFAKALGDTWLKLNKKASSSPDSASSTTSTEIVTN